MNALKYIQDTYKVNINQKRQPVEIPNTTRETLAQMFADLGYKIGAEVGVEQGLYSELICQKNPGVKLFCIDAWTAYKGYRDHTGQAKLDSFYEITKERMKPYNAELIRGFSLDVVNQFEDDSLDFVYIDANHEFVHVVEDIAAWERKVRVGGILAGHDYIRRKTNGYLMHVPMAIHGWCESYQVKPLFVLGRKEAKANLNPKRELRDSTRSWFFVKPPKDPMRPGWNGWEKPLDNK